MWRLHRACRWIAAALVHHAGRSRRRQEDHHDRRPVAGRQPSGATRLGRTRRGPVRLLPVRPDHVGGRVAGEGAGSDRYRYRPGPVRQHLPLRHISAHPCGGASRGGTRQGLSSTPLLPGLAGVSIPTKQRSNGGSMNAVPRLSRRDFLKTSVVMGGGLVLAFVIPGAKRFAFANQAADGTAAFAPNAFLRIGSDDTVTVLIAHSEMGQGIWTALPMLIAEDLDADWSKIKVEHAPAAPTYAHTGFGMQMTGGSSSTWSEFDRYRQAGAAARALLMQAAATRFNVPLDQVRTENGEIIAGTNRVRYGALA